MTQRSAEVASDGAPEEEPVLLGKGTVEPEGRAEELVVLLGPLRPHVQRGGIAREMHDHEHDPRDAQENEQRPREALAEVRDHVRLLTLMRKPSHARSGRIVDEWLAALPDRARAMRHYTGSQPRRSGR